MAQFCQNGFSSAKKPLIIVFAYGPFAMMEII